METEFKYGVKYWAALALKTREAGSCYVHAPARRSLLSWQAFEHEGMSFRYRGYGHSLEGGGHKYKVHAEEDGRPVPSKKLRALLSPWPNK